MVWIIVMFLSAVWTLILTAPIHCQSIHCWASDGMLHFSKSDEETNSSTYWMSWGWAHFQQSFILVNYSFKWEPLVYLSVMIHEPDTCTVTCNPNCEDKVPGLAKSLARRPGAIVFSSRATKIYHRPARRATLSPGLPRNVPSKLRAQGRTLLQPRPRRRNNVPARTQKLVGKAIWLNASKSKRIAMLRQTAYRAAAAIELEPVMRFTGFIEENMCAKWVAVETDTSIVAVRSTWEQRNAMTCEINVIMY